MDSWNNIYFGLPYLSQESMVFFSTAAHLLILSWAFSYSPTKLQNYSLMNIWFRPLKHQKVAKNKNKIDRKWLKKHHGYICWIYHWLVITRFPALSDNSKDNSKFESCLQKWVQNKKKTQILISLLLVSLLAYIN